MQLCIINLPIYTPMNAESILLEFIIAITMPYVIWTLHEKIVTEKNTIIILS